MLWGSVLCAVGCMTASLASTYCMRAVSPPIDMTTKNHLCLVFRFPCRQNHPQLRTTGVYPVDCPCRKAQAVIWVHRRCLEPWARLAGGSHVLADTWEAIGGKGLRWRKQLGLETLKVGRRTFWASLRDAGLRFLSSTLTLLSSHSASGGRLPAFGSYMVDKERC